MKPRTLQGLATVALLAALGWTLVARKPVAARTDHPTATADKPAIKVRSAANLKLTGWNGPVNRRTSLRIGSRNFSISGPTSR